MKKFNFKMKYLVIGLIATILALVGFLAFQQNKALKEQEKILFDQLLSSKLTKEYESRIKDKSGNNGLDSTPTVVQAGDYIEAKINGTVYSPSAPDGQILADNDFNNYISVVDLGSSSIVRNIALGATLNENHVKYIELSPGQGLSHIVLKTSKIYRLSAEEQNRIYKEAEDELPAYVEQTRKDAKTKLNQNGLGS